MTKELKVKIYINPDRTIEQLRLFKKFREKLKRKQTMVKRNNLNIKYVIKNNKIVKASNHHFRYDAQALWYKGTDCKSDLINFNKNVNLSTSFNKINNSSYNSYTNSNLKIFYTNLPPRKSGVSVNCKNLLKS